MEKHFLKIGNEIKKFKKNFKIRKLVVMMEFFF